MSDACIESGVVACEYKGQTVNYDLAKFQTNGARVTYDGKAANEHAQACYRALQKVTCQKPEKATKPKPSRRKCEHLESFKNDTGFDLSQSFIDNLKGLLVRNGYCGRVVLSANKVGNSYNFEVELSITEDGKYKSKRLTIITVRQGREIPESWLSSILRSAGEKFPPKEK